MHYDNQLIKTGEINDVGYFTSKNVKSSFRRGIEVEGAYMINKNFKVNGNLTISENKVDILITDWSGFALEYYLTTGKSIIFIDTPPKIRNEKFKEIKLKSFEDLIRTNFGINLQIMIRYKIKKIKVKIHRIRFIIFIPV